MRQFKKVRLWPLWGIIGLPLMGVLVAFFLYYYGDTFLHKTTNKGHFLTPALLAQNLFFSEDFKGKKPFDMTEKGVWRILYLTDDGVCDTTCFNRLDTIERVHIALNKDYARVRRHIVYPFSQIRHDDRIKDKVNRILYTDIALFRQLLASSLSHSKAVASQLQQDITTVIMDPLGNIMMAYDRSQGGRELVADIQKLLRISNIG